MEAGEREVEEKETAEECQGATQEPVLPPQPFWG